VRKGAGRSHEVERLTRIVGAAGVAGILGGLAAWIAVRAQLAGEKIVVPQGAVRCGGRLVQGPLSAYTEADFIKQAALGATGGRTYGEMDDGDPAAGMAKDASLLRASLFTSILAFGVAAAGMAVGAVLLVVARALATATAAPPPPRR